MSNQKSGKRMNGKGYYIALILCAFAIGISGYVYYQNANEVDDPQLSGTDVNAGVTAPAEGEDVQVVATRPDTDGSQTDEQDTLPVKRQPIRTAAPVEGQTVAPYAMEALSYNATTRDWRVHNGVDIAAEAGTPVCAAADGTVYTVYQDETMGMTVVISHEDGYTTVYSSLGEDVTVSTGDPVALGQIIGCVGQTALLESAIGDHVHFSVSCDGEPMDPAEFLAME